MRSPIANGCSKDNCSLPTGQAPFTPLSLSPASDPPPRSTPARAGDDHDNRRGARRRTHPTPMPGLFAYSGAGLGLLALAALESLPLPHRFPPHHRLLPRRLATPLHLRHLLAAALSLLCLLSALVSAHHLSLPTLAASALFLLYSLAPFAPLAAPLPFPLLDLLLAAAFAQELLLFAHRRPSTAAGIENRYFDLLLVPIALCLGATLLAAHRPGDAAPRLARAAGLALHGTWMVQMGFSFFTSAIAQGCTLHAASRADYTIKCHTHEDYHRARSVATLQFNGHLALLVIAGATAYAAVLSRANRPPSGYSVLGKEVQMEGVPIMSQFTLDSDEEKEDEGTTATAAPVANGVESHDEIPLHAPGSDSK